MCLRLALDATIPIAIGSFRYITANRIAFIEPLDDRWILPVSKEKDHCKRSSVSTPCYSPMARPWMYTSWAVVENMQDDLRLFHLSVKIPRRPHN